MIIRQPVGAFIPDTDLWMMRETWRLDTPFGTLIILPGFLTDGASVPLLLRGLVGARYAPRTFAAAVAHDAGYSSRKLKRPQADSLFREMLAQLLPVRPSRFCVVVLARAAFKWAKVYSYYLAVRVVGWWPYYLSRNRRIVSVARETVFVQAKGEQ